MPLVNSETTPLVSIVIPVYNGANYLKEAVDSALSQTYENTEILVVNDGSKDNGATRDIALSYGDRIRYFEKENGGVSSALNTGIRNMKGTYFSWLSHDDKYAPEKISHQVDVLNGRSGFVALDDYLTINADSAIMGRSKAKPLFQKTENTAFEAFRAMFRGVSFSGCSFLIPREVFEKCGLFDESLRYVQDLKMWMLFFLNGYGIIYNTQADVFSRVHEQQLTQTGQDLFCSESVRLAQMMIPEIVKADSREEGLLFSYAMYFAKYHVSDGVRMCIDAADEHNLFSAGQRIRLKAFALYGAVRPSVRRLYYKLFRSMKTK